MTNKNFLSKTRSPFLGSQSSDVGSRCRVVADLLPSFCRVNMLKLVSVLVLVLTLGVGQMWGATVTYTVTGASAVSTTGTAPAGSSATLSGTGSYTSSWIQCTYGKNKVLTLSGYNGYKITGITIYVKSNASKGTGSFTAVAGSTTIASIAESAFNSANWNGSWNSTGVSKVLTMSNNSYEIQKNESVVLTIACKSGSNNYNSLYIQSYTITYEAAAACSTPPTVGSSLTSVSATVNSITATVPISAIGGCNITENGLVYSTSVATPTVGAANCTKVTTTACGSTAANKTVTISDLPCGTSYYVRGYATNAAGTSYTNVTTQSTSACPLYTVTLMDDSDTRTQASYGAAVTLPSRAGCSGYTFAGWSTTYNANWTTTVPTIISAGSYTPTDNINLYPVYTKTEGGSEEDHDGPSWIRSGGSNTYTSGYTFATAGSMGSSTDYYQDGSATTGQVKLYHTSTAIFSSTPTSVKLTAKIGGGTGGTSLNTPVYAQLLNSSGTAIGNATEITSYITTNTGDTYTDVELDLTGITSAYGVMVYHAKQTSYNVRYYSFSLTYTTGGSTTYYISVPNCCTALASINGSILWSMLFSFVTNYKSIVYASFVIGANL